MNNTSRRAIIESIAAVENSAQAEHSVLPVDITGGRVFEKLKTEKSFFEHIKSGGVVVYPIIILGIAALFIILDRFIFLRKTYLSILKNQNVFTEVIEKNEGILSSQRIPQIYKALLNSITSNRDLPTEELQKKIQETVSLELPVLERRITALQVISAVTPLLGLLGTVTGIITTFDAITAFGSSDPRLLSTGISEALVTTELGLIVAIPAYLTYSYLSSRVDEILSLLQQISYNALELKR